MFRSPQPGDWAAEDEDTSPLPTPTPAPPTQEPAPPAAAPAARSGGNNSGGSRCSDREGGALIGTETTAEDSLIRIETTEEDALIGTEDTMAVDDMTATTTAEDTTTGEATEGVDAMTETTTEEHALTVMQEATREEDVLTPHLDGDTTPTVEAVEPAGFIVSIKENFGFVSCMGRDGDLFFHISEAPVDVQLQDEVEFRVKYNQRSDKEMACQLVALPKGTIKVEEVSEEFYDGVVTKSLPRGGHGGGRGFFNNRDDDRRQREEHGLIEVKKSETEGENPTEEEQEQTEEDDKKTLARREFVRFTGESVAAIESDQEQPGRSKKNLIPHFGDEVRFRIAKHRKTGAKRAVDITITVSAREKLDKEIEAKLATMTRETGVVDRVKNGGGFIKCCDRPVDVYFPFHEIRESEEHEKETESEDKSRHGRQGKAPSIHEGVEVSFFVYEDHEDDSGRSRPRLTALRVQKLPPGTVSFEELLRSDVEGFVSKLPKEPRNGPEVIGSIAVASAEPIPADEGEETQETTASESEGKPLKKKKGKDGKAKKQKVAFRLCDAEDMGYIPHIDDKVAFDEVLDKRTGKVKAVKVRVVQLNPKNRETGVINAMKEDFGFIKCAERSGDAYFRFSDVMGASRSFNNGTEVAFDVLVDNKSDHIRATRLQILPRGTIKWEDVAAEGLEGKIVALPSSRRGHHSTRGGRGDKTKQLQKFVPGKIRFVTPGKQHLIDFLPELKEKLDAAFITSHDAPEEAEDDEDKSEDKTDIRISFANSLSKFERAALHEYSDWLGLKHESSGEGSHRQLEIVGSDKISLKTVGDKLAASAPELTVEFLEDDVSDVRYNPRVGDRVKFDLVVVKRTKQFQCKAIKCVEAASAKNMTASTKTDAAKGEGFIVSVKAEGFGFIQPAQTVPGSLEENLFFHIKEITTGQTLAELKEGTEVQYTVFVDEKKKKNRATAIAVVPAGTIKTVVSESVKGVVTKASFLQRMKGGSKGRFTKANNKASTLGRIRLATTSNEEDDDAGSEDGDSDEEAEESEEGTQENGDAEIESKDAKKKKKESTQKKPGKQVYVYNIRDIADPTAVLREGDEVEFIPQVTPKSLRAAHIRLVSSHAKQGVVTRITEDLGGVIQLDGDEPFVEARFTARAVLRGDILSEGDRVEFAYRQPSATAPIKKKEDKKEEGDEEKTKDEEATNETEPALGQALSVLRLSSSPNRVAPSQSRGSRSVNSTLREAMRQVGANAMVASRMAKGPDGTRGFIEGWNSTSVETTTTTTTTDESEA
ncbi:Nucleic acid-binding, OB-fold [Phytophthora cactorum]|nr:Nucleic acid-binding, OB-fold [Phytophthora cactorum]